MSRALANDRLQLGDAAILSPSRAAELLPFRESEALAWLRDNGLVRRVAGLGEVVVWGDVVARIRRGEEPQAKPARPAKGGRLARAGLLEE